jgi:5-methylthioadenosine/S-adenosylhomocysteine deaminase
MGATLFRDVLVYDPAAPDGSFGPTDVRVEDQLIAAVGDGASDGAGPDARIVAGRGHRLLLPGLINAHFHSPANHLKGAFPSLPLELFMLVESPPGDAFRPTPREAYLRTMLAALEMLRSGTTAVQDDAFLLPHPETEIIDAVMQAYADCGIRAAVALDQPEVSESQKLPYLADTATGALREELDRPPGMSAADLLGMYDHLVSRWHGAERGRLTAAVSISAPQRVSVAYFEALDELSRRHGLPLFAHMLETKVQRLLAHEQPRFGGRSLVGYTADLGLLSDRMNVIHAIWVDEEDLDLIAGAGAVIAHNPVSNLRLGSGVMPFRMIADRGIPVCLGVDEAICDDSVNMWSVVKTAGLIHNISGLDSALWPSAAEVLDCLWTGGARAMGKQGRLGAIREGHLADLTLVDLHSIAFTPLNDLRRQLVYCHSGESVVLTMVDGRVVFEGGHVTTVDEDALLGEARELFAQRRSLRAGAYQLAERWMPEYEAMVDRARTADVGMSRWLAT